MYKTYLFDNAQSAVRDRSIQEGVLFNLFYFEQSVYSRRQSIQEGGLIARVLYFSDEDANRCKTFFVAQVVPEIYAKNTLFKNSQMFFLLFTVHVRQI